MYWTGSARFLASLILVLTASCWMPSSLADPLYGQQNRAGTDKRKAARFKQFQADMFTIPPSLPNLPEIGGSKLLRGCAFRKVEGGPCYSMRFVCNRSPEEIYDFYKNALSSKPWTLNPGGNSSCLSALDKDKRVCQVSILGGSCKAKKWQTQYTVNYTLIQPSS